MLCTPNTGRNSHFQRFSAKKLKKQEIHSKFLQKHIFLSLHQNAGRLFFLFFATLKMTILTRVWNAQHPNAGRNIQQLPFWQLSYSIIKQT